MTEGTNDTGRGSRSFFDETNYNLIGGGAFALWGLLHIVVGALALWIFFFEGTDAMLAFVNIDAAANPAADRMADLVAEFYQALLLVGLVVTVVGITLNRRGEPLGLWLNGVLVTAIDAFFIWFEVLPGHRPVPVAVVSVALLVVGVVFCWLGLDR